MEGIERTTAVVVRGQGQGAGQGVGAFFRRDPYAMEVDKGRNCYACGGFVLWDAWNMNNFYFPFLLFSDFIGFCFLFFLFWTMKRHVTSQSHDVSHDMTS